MDSNTLHMRSSSKASRPRRSARTTQTWEKRRARASRTSGHNQPVAIFERDSARDAVVLVVSEDVEALLRTKAAVEGGALVADGMAVALLVGGDAGISGDVGDGAGRDDLQRDGERSGMYERSEGA